MKETYQELKYVVDNSMYVKINYNKIVEFAQELKTPSYKHWFADINIKVTENQKILLAFIIESLNFCFWPKPKYKIIYHNEEVKGSEALFLRIIKEVEINKKFLNINYLHNMTLKEFSYIFTGISLVSTRYKLFKDTIDVIYKKQDKFYNELFSIKKDYELLNYIITNFKYFNDSATYKGKTIHFNKRATLLVNDLFYMSKTINNNIKNVNNMFGCADYGIPRTLKNYDILEYNKELETKINNKIELKAGSTMEIEIRANMLYALEEIKKELLKRNININSIQLDNIIWQMGRLKQNICPYHHTQTIFY